jgi:hypothetical protein
LLGLVSGQVSTNALSAAIISRGSAYCLVPLSAHVSFPRRDWVVAANARRCRRNGHGNDQIGGREWQ